MSGVGGCAELTANTVLVSGSSLRISCGDASSFSGQWSADLCRKFGPDAQTLSVQVVDGPASPRLQDLTNRHTSQRKPPRVVIGHVLVRLQERSGVDQSQGQTVPRLREQQDG